MKDKIKLIMLIIILLLGTIVVYLFFSNKAGEYHFTGEIIDDENSVSVDAFLIQNNNGTLLTYSTTIEYSKEKIVSARLCYDKYEKKNIILGNALNSYDFSTIKGEKYETDYISNLLKYPIYFELCKDSECENVYKTIELKKVLLK